MRLIREKARNWLTNRLQSRLVTGHTGPDPDPDPESQSLQGERETMNKPGVEKHHFFL